MHKKLRAQKILLLLGLLLLAYLAKAQITAVKQNQEELSLTLASKDSLMFTAFFNCNINLVRSMLTDDFVFFHDNGYNSKSVKQPRKEFLESLQKNFCEARSSMPKMRREVVAGSLEVHSLNKVAAVQTGVQHFYITIEDNTQQLVEVSKFSRQWVNQNGQWKLASEMDYLVDAKPANVRVSSVLYNEIALMDSILFNAFNGRDTTVFKKFFAEDLEFYHDEGGLTGYQHSIEFMRSTAKNNNGLRRDLVPASLEVYPIPNYGAIEIGSHTFCHLENGKQECGTFKFVHIWKKTGNDWKITRVVSYGH